jgi:hypothetical protein
MGDLDRLTSTRRALLAGAVADLISSRALDGSAIGDAKGVKTLHNGGVSTLR